MVQEESGSIVVDDSLKLQADISALFLNKKFSDVTLIVDGQKLPAHKVILAARSKYFEDLLYDELQQDPKHEVTIDQTTPESFQKILKYIYTGSLKLELSEEANVYFEVLCLAHQNSLKELETLLNEKFENLLDRKNICNVLNMVNLFGMDESIEKCHQFLEASPKELITSNDFSKLTQTSMVNLLRRDTFVLPELEIFNIISKWRKSNEDVDDKVLNCVRLSEMNVVEIVSEIWPSKMFECDKLLGAIAEIVDVRPTTPRCRRHKLINVDLTEDKSVGATLTLDPVIFECDIGDKNGIIFELPKTYLINKICMDLLDKDLSSYMYYVELSCNKEKWKKVLDYSNYPCRSRQSVFFDPQGAKYIRVVGTHNTKNLRFQLTRFEAYYTTNDYPKIVNNIVCPTKNVATLQKGAAVIEGEKSDLIDENSKFFDDSTGYSFHVIGSGSIIIQLAQPFIVSTCYIQLYNLDYDKRVYKYYIETSTNKIDWEIAVDRRNKECEVLETITFTERVVIFIRITGTYSSVGDSFRCVLLRCPSVR